MFNCKNKVKYGIPTRIRKVPFFKKVDTVICFASPKGMKTDAVKVAYRKLHVKLGLCQWCSELALVGQRLCLRHDAINLERQRERMGTNPWVEGGRGRRPRAVGPKAK